MSESRPTSLDRRRFIRGVAAGGTLAAGAAAAGVRLGAEVADERRSDPADANATRARGYRETAHVRRYYDLARF